MMINKLKNSQSYGCNLGINNMNYLYYNPVKHGYVKRVRDWKYSSFHRDVKKGIITRRPLDDAQHARLKRQVYHLQYCRQDDNHEYDNATNPPDYEKAVYQNGGDLHQWQSVHEDTLICLSGSVYRAYETL